TSGLKLGNDFIEFKARFGGVAREIIVPVDHVVAIYARENGQGMAFPMPSSAPEGAPAGMALAPEGAEAGRSGRGLRLARSEPAAPTPTSHAPAAGSEPGDDEPPPPPRPALKRIK